MAKRKDKYIESIADAQRKLAEAVTKPLSVFDIPTEEIAPKSKVVDAMLETYGALRVALGPKATSVNKADMRWAFLKLKKEVEEYVSVSAFAAKRLDPKAIDILVDKVLEVTTTGVKK